MSAPRRGRGVSPRAECRPDHPRLGMAFLVALLAACAPTPEGRVVVDAVGREVVVPRSPQRVVTLAPDITEIVAHIGALDRIAGTDSASDHPPLVRELPKVGALEPNIEAIAALDPDLVLASTEGNPPSLEPALRAAGIPLFVVRTDRLAEIPRAMETVGDVLRIDASAAARRMREDLAAARRTRDPEPRVLVLLWPEPLYVAGRETFLDDLLEAAGGENAVEARGWPSMSVETLIADPPDLILYPKNAVPPSAFDTPAFRSLDEVERIAVDDDRFLRPGPRVTEALAELNRILDAWERR